MKKKILSLIKKILISKRVIKKNITPSKKINGKISNTIDGIFKIVKIIGKYIPLSLFSKNFISSKIFKKKLKKINTTITVNKFFKNKVVR